MFSNGTDNTTAQVDFQDDFEIVADGASITDINCLWTIFGTVLVFWMHAGFSLLEAGSIRTKNTQNILFKNLMNVVVTTLTWWLIGYALAFGEDTNGFVGAGFKGFTTNNITSGGSMTETMSYAHWLFQWAFAATSATIVSGGMAERANTTGYFFLILVLNIIVYPFVCHWVWGGGWLAQKGYLDFAGSSVVHTVGGTAACIGCFLLGPRRGEPQADSVALIVLGTLILWMGWFGFNGASGALAGTDANRIVGLTLVNTTIAASAGGLVVLMWYRYRRDRLLVSEFCNGILAGLVSITASCDNVTDYSALIIGSLGGLFYVLGQKILQLSGIDDAIGATPVHGVCGIWGTLSVGLFNRDHGVFMGAGFTSFAWQLVGIITIICWTVLWALIVLGSAKKIGILRVSAEVEDVGLDAMFHVESTVAELCKAAPLTLQDMRFPMRGHENRAQEMTMKA